MDRCAPTGMAKCFWQQLNPHTLMFSVSRVVFIRERSSVLCGSVVLCHVLF